MDAKKVIETNRILVRHKKAVMAVQPKAQSRLGKPQQEKQSPMIKALRRTVSHEKG